MKVKTTEAKDKALDWMVARAMKAVPHPVLPWQPSTNWSQGGPIIDAEGIEFRASGTQASIVDGRTYYGPTHLIAAMRCYVASKLGDEVEVPDDLTP